MAESDPYSGTYAMDRRSEGAVEGAKRLHAEAIAAMARFIAIEIETGLVLCQVAKVRKPGGLRMRALENARTAYDSAEKWMGKLQLQLKHERIDQFAAQLERLGFELDSVAPRASR